MKVVSELLGHVSAALTLDVYSHVLPHMQAEAVALVEARWQRGLTGLATQAGLVALLLGASEDSRILIALSF